MHFIQSHILDSLVQAKTLRNRDMRPPGVESNLYQYHLLQVQRDGYVTKTPNGYTLTGLGLAYADRHSVPLKKPRPQPKIVTVLFVTDPAGRIAMKPKIRQPFIGDLSVPFGKLHLQETIAAAVEREMTEKLGFAEGIEQMRHIGSAHITLMQGDVTVSDYMALLVHAPLSYAPKLTNGADFFDPADVDDRLAPGSIELISAFRCGSVFYEATVCMSDSPASR